MLPSRGDLSRFTRPPDPYGARGCNSAHCRRSPLGWNLSHERPWRPRSRSESPFPGHGPPSHHFVRHNYAKAKSQTAKAKNYRTRCKTCGARKSLPWHPSSYIQRWVCESCGRTGQRNDVLRVDWFRTTKLEARRFLCTCPGAAEFPHQRNKGRIRPC